MVRGLCQGTDGGDPAGGQRGHGEGGLGFCCPLGKEKLHRQHNAGGRWKESSCCWVTELLASGVRRFWQELLFFCFIFSELSGQNCNSHHVTQMSHFQTTYTPILTQFNSIHLCLYSVCCNQYCEETLSRTGLARRWNRTQTQLRFQSPFPGQIHPKHTSNRSFVSIYSIYTLRLNNLRT